MLEHDSCKFQVHVYALYATLHIQRKGKSRQEFYFKGRELKFVFIYMSPTKPVYQCVNAGVAFPWIFLQTYTGGEMDVILMKTKEYKKKSRGISVQK